MTNVLMAIALLRRLWNYAKSNPEVPVLIQIEGQRAVKVIHSSLTFHLDDGQQLILTCRAVDGSSSA